MLRLIITNFIVLFCTKPFILPRNRYAYDEYIIYTMGICELVNKTCFGGELLFTFKYYIQVYTD